MKRPIGIAHRGFSGMAPENTLISFAKALECKPDAVECDIHLSSDGYLMIIHDGTLERTTSGHGKVGKKSYAELRKLDAGSWFSPKFMGEKIPILEELIELTKGKIELCIELKGKGTARKAVSMIEQFDIMDQVALFSFWPEEIMHAKQLNPRIPTLLLRYYLDLQEPVTLKPVDIAREVLAADANILGINKEIITPDLIQTMHHRAITVSAYTVNTIDVMKTLIQWDVDGIVSDYPDLLMKILNEINPT